MFPPFDCDADALPAGDRCDTVCPSQSPDFLRRRTRYIPCCWVACVPLTVTATYIAMTDDVYFYLSAFHANVDLSEDTSIRQRYTQDISSFLFFYIYYSYSY